VSTGPIGERHRRRRQPGAGVTHGDSVASVIASPG
jgi:hypothetical protein